MSNGVDPVAERPARRPCGRWGLGQLLPGPDGLHVRLLVLLILVLGVVVLAVAGHGPCAVAIVFAAGMAAADIAARLLGPLPHQCGS